MAKGSLGVSYVMPVLNEEKYLRAAVESILAQNYDGKVEIVLALGNSSDRTNDIARELQQEYAIKLVDNPTGTTSAGLNLAIAEASNEIVVRVDAHSKLSDGYTTLAVESLVETKAANVGGLMRAVGDNPFQKAVAWAYMSRIGLGGGAFHVGASAGPADSVYLGVFQRSALLEVGGFDERIIRGQDWELNLRLREAGKVVWFDPRLEVEYHPRSSWRKLAKQFFDTGVWRGQLTRKSPGRANLRYFAPPVLVLAALLGVPLCLYLFVVALAALFAASEVGWPGALYLLIVLPTMHFAWGAGFIIGFLRPKI
jgi:succinoglycan biosynthesis protein ExoA